MWILIKVRKSD